MGNKKKRDEGEFGQRSVVDLVVLLVVIHDNENQDL